MNSSSFLFLVASVFFCLVFQWEIAAQAPAFYTEDPGKVMLQGNDVISYYTNPRPVAGQPEYSVHYQGFYWHFANKSNRNKFSRHPEMYIPEFGGYCVWAIAHGRLTGGQPHLWKVVEGRLYFFCSESAMAKWMAQRELINRLARENWPDILQH